MTKEIFLLQLSSLTGTKLVEFINQFAKPVADIQTWLAQYDPNQHEVFDTIKRPDKPVRKPTGYLDAQGNQVMQTIIQSVSRIAVDAQQDITKNAAGILCANKIELEGNKDNIQKVWNENKLDFKTISICQYWLSETEVAELWYKEKDKYKVLVLANSLGDKLYPVIDNLGDLICFARSYQAKEIVEGSEELQAVTFYEIYTDTKVIKGDNSSNETYIFDAPVSHGFSKIPVMYATRNFPIWHNVQTSIVRFETSISNLCDTNDYFGSPTAVVHGKIKSYADKGESGKILQLDPADANAKIEYLTWNQAPESLKLEWSELQKIIMNSTRTVSLTLENLKGLFGSAPSAYAIKLLFTPAHMQAAEHEEVFGEYIQRRLNFMSSIIGGDATAKFTYYLPHNEKEDNDNILASYTGGILSLESAVSANSLSVNAIDEYQRLKKEQIVQDAKAAKMQANALALKVPVQNVPVAAP